MASTLTKGTNEAGKSMAELADFVRSLGRRTSHWTHLGAGGRVVIPADIRKALGMKPGERVLVEIVDGSVQISTRERSMRRVQEQLRPILQGQPSLVDELIAERRREAEAEE